MRFNMTSAQTGYFSLKVRLVILLVVTILPFIIFSTYKAYDINKRLEEDAYKESLRLAKSVAYAIDSYVESTGDLLVSIANDEIVHEQNYPAVKSYLKEIWPKYPAYSNIIFVDMDGNIKAAGRPKRKGEKSKVNVSDTVYYKRAIKSNGLSFGDFMYGKVSGTPVVHITYPVFDSSGKRVGFMAAAFDLTKVQNKLMEPSIPDYVEIGVVSDKGIVVARNREPKKFIGMDVSKELVFKNMLNKTEGLDRIPAPDGATRIFGFATAKKIPWYIRGGVDTAYLQDQVKRQLTDHLTLFIPLLLVAFFGWYWIGRDVTKLHKRTEHLSLIDPLTGLWNSRKLHQDLERKINHANRYNEPLSFAMIDIDHFKHYNDHNGHQAGDDALYHVANIICDAVRECDYVYRYGGEEMCVLFPATDKAGALSVAERIRSEVERASFFGEDNQPNGNLTISIGVASHPHDSMTKDELVRSADIALYKAKDKGRNRVEAYDGSGDSNQFHTPGMNGQAC